VDFDVIDQLLVRFLYLSDTGEKWEYNGTVHQLLLDCEKTYESAMREVLYGILIEFSTSMKSIRLTKTCLNESYIIVRRGENCLMYFLFRMV
jgi:hypothetical protein